MELCTEYVTFVHMWVLGVWNVSKLCSYGWWNWCELLWYELRCWIGHGFWCACVNRFGVCISRSGEVTKTQIMLLHEHLAQVRESGSKRQAISPRRVCLAQARIQVCCRVFLGGISIRQESLA